MSAEVVERRVDPSEWLPAVRAARHEGFGYFDWLAAVDETDVDGTDAGASASGEERADAEEQPTPGPGLDVVCHLMDVSRASSGGLLVAS